jgi:hypothetical protein
MSKTYTLAIFIAAAVASSTPAWGQSAPVVRELSAPTALAAPVELATQRVTIRLPLREDARAQIEAAVGSSSKTILRLTVEGVQYDTSDVHYEVYVDLPEGAAPDYKSAHFVGMLAPFLHQLEHENPYTVRFDITRNVRELMSSKLWNDAELSVTFVMRGLVDRNGRQLPVPPGARGRVTNLKVAAISPQ